MKADNGRLAINNWQPVKILSLTFLIGGDE